MNWRLRLDLALLGVEVATRYAWERATTGVTFTPRTQALRSNPHPLYRRLRETDPVHRSQLAGGYVLSRYEDVQSVIADRRFSSDERNWNRYGRFARLRRLADIPDPYESGLAAMLRMDPPDHTRLRGLATKAFTPRAIDQWQPRMQAVAHALLHRIAPHGPFDLVRDFAGPLPVVVIAELLGVPSEEHERFRQLSDRVVKSLGDGSLDDVHDAFVARDELARILEGIAADRRAQPREDLISGLVAAEEAGDRLTRDELISTCILLLVAGNETTTKLIGNSVVALLANPAQGALLREEPKRIPGAVEELLRYDGPVQLTSRLATEDCDLFGEPVKRGMQIVLLLAAANRDPARFADPDRLDVTRDDVRHLAFGHGTHFCLGARLARLETAVALEALLARLPRLEHAGEVAWSTNTVLRGPTSLPLRS